MKVVVGSTNAPKRNAVEQAFVAAFAGEKITVEAVATDSGVRPHPISGEEAIAGALNRAAQAEMLLPGADYYVGIEGGLMQIDERAWEISYVAICNSVGKIATGLSAGIEIRGQILEAIRNGVELSDVLEQKFGVVSAGMKSGFYGLATNELVTRQAASEQAVLFALAPFLHPEYYEQ